MPRLKRLWAFLGHLSNTFFTRYPGATNMCDSGFIPRKGITQETKMEPHGIVIPIQISPLPQIQLHVDEPEIWDPPFERWIQLADALLIASRASNSGYETGKNSRFQARNF
jgi:hypothetical protein